MQLRGRTHYAAGAVPKKNVNPKFSLIFFKISFKIRKKISKARAAHRVSMKPGLDESPAQYCGHLPRQDPDDPVKKYLGDKRKEWRRKDKVLRENLQGEEEVEGADSDK